MKSETQFPELKKMILEIIFKKNKSKFKLEIEDENLENLKNKCFKIILENLGNEILNIFEIKSDSESESYNSSEYDFELNIIETNKMRKMSDDVLWEKNMDSTSNLNLNNLEYLEKRTNYFRDRYLNFLKKLRLQNKLNKKCFDDLKPNSYTKPPSSINTLENYNFRITKIIKKNTDNT